MLKKLLFLLLSSSTTLLTMTTSASQNVPVGPDSVFVQDTAVNELKFMSYNVLNLFDTEKDGDNEDWPFLPLNYPNKLAHCAELRPGIDQKMCRELDWNPARLNMKLDQIAQVIRFQGSLPDVLVLVEVENEKVIELMTQKLGYDDFSVTDSQTRRGTDVAILYKKSKLTRISDESINATKPGTDGTRTNKTRDILRVDFQVNGSSGSTLSVYANHWPSQANPVENRIFAAQQLMNDIQKQNTRFGSAQHYSVSLGDYNVIDKDSPNAMKDILYSSASANKMVDGKSLAMQVSGNPAIPYMPSGTYYYSKDRAWNELDRIVLSSNLNAGANARMSFVPLSYRVIFPQFMSTSYSEHSIQGSESVLRPIRVPRTYNFFANSPADAGYSDHLPIVFKLKY